MMSSMRKTISPVGPVIGVQMIGSFAVSWCAFFSNALYVSTERKGLQTIKINKISSETLKRTKCTLSEKGGRHHFSCFYKHEIGTFVHVDVLESLGRVGLVHEGNFKLVLQALGHADTGTGVSRQEQTRNAAHTSVLRGLKNKNMGVNKKMHNVGSSVLDMHTATLSRQNSQQ